MHNLTPLLLLTAVALIPMGCGRPDQANIQLRKEKQALEAQIEQLQRQREADVATIRALEQQRGTVPTLPQERLESLFTAAGIKLGRLTGGYDLDPQRPGDEVLEVHVVPVDTAGDLLKSAGTFRVQAIDPENPQDPIVAQEQWTPEQARERWFGKATQYGYVLQAPWRRAPSGNSVLLTVTFTDALTGRTFTADQRVNVDPPPVAPTTSPAEPR